MVGLGNIKLSTWGSQKMTSPNTQEAQKERHVPSVDTYGALVECCARQQQWQEALKLLQAHNATATGMTDPWIFRTVPYTISG